jgi:hypothetical protein
MLSVITQLLFGFGSENRIKSPRVELASITAFETPLMVLWNPHIV